MIMLVQINIASLLLIFLAAKSEVFAAKESKGRDVCPEICEPEKCPNVGPIGLSKCPEVYIVTDSCGCCKRCDVKYVTTTVSANKRDEVCKEMTCPKKKVCVLNIQGLPVCKCPTVELCRKFAGHGTGKTTKVCGTDNITYMSRCHLKVASCDSDGKIRVSIKGQCPVTASRKQPNNQPRKRPTNQPRKQQTIQPNARIFSPTTRRHEGKRQSSDEGHNLAKAKNNRRGERKQQKRNRKREKNYQRAFRIGKSH